MESLLCHTGRIFTLDELGDQAKAEPETMPRELNELPKDRKEDDMPNGLPVEQRATGRCISAVAGCMNGKTSHRRVTSGI